MTSIEYRNTEPDSRALREMQEINQYYAEMLGSLTCEELSTLISKCAWVVSAFDEKQCVGFVTVFDETSEYESENFRWFQAGYDSFLYVDRVAVHPSWQGRSIARAMYGQVANHTRESGRSMICCEVSTIPKNDASLRFHDSMGFHSCGTRSYDMGKRELVMLNHRVPGRLLESRT